METNNTHNDSFDGKSPIPKQNNFKIPEGYFEELTAQMEQELSIKDEPRKKGTLRVMVLNISIAAAVVLGVFLFNPQKEGGFVTASSELEITADADAIYVEDYLISMVESTENWQPLMYFEVDLTEVSAKEIEAIEMPVVDAVTSDDLTDFFEDEDYYEF